MRTKLATGIVLPLILAACSGLGAQNQPQAITIEAAAMHYQPTSIEVTVGQPVELTFKNSDSVDHDFSVMEIPLVTGSMQQSSSPMPGHDMSGMAGMPGTPALHVAVPMGTTGKLQFTASKPGTYEFYCTVPGHKEAGMVGTLVVKAQ